MRAVACRVGAAGASRIRGNIRESLVLLCLAALKQRRLAIFDGHGAVRMNSGRRASRMVRRALLAAVLTAVTVFDG